MYHKRGDYWYFDFLKLCATFGKCLNKMKYTLHSAHIMFLDSSMDSKAQKNTRFWTQRSQRHISGSSREDLEQPFIMQVCPTSHGSHPLKLSALLLFVTIQNNSHISKYFWGRCWEPLVTYSHLQISWIKPENIVLYKQQNNSCLCYTCVSVYHLQSTFYI